VVVANGSHVAKGVPIAPEADPADGLMDVVAIREISLPALALHAPEILAATHLDNREILHFRARRLSIESTPPMIFNADGEVLGEGACEFEVLRAAISFLVPSEPDK
jgi:diacylglycerol kinase (ATP)